MPDVLTPELKAKIDRMPHEEMCRLWRFAPVGHPYLQGVVGDYFSQRLKELGGFTSEISKRIGWAR